MLLVDAFERRNDGLRRHKHACAAAEGIVVAFQMFIRRVVANIDDINLHFSVLDGTSDNAFGQRRKHFGKKGKNINPHNEPRS